MNQKAKKIILIAIELFLFSPVLLAMIMYWSRNDTNFYNNIHGIYNSIPAIVHLIMEYLYFPLSMLDLSPNRFTGTLITLIYTSLLMWILWLLGKKILKIK